MGRVQGETVVCIDCHEPFTWSYGEQDFYRKLGHQPPKRCRRCRLAHDNILRSSAMDHSPFAAPLPVDLFAPEDTAVPPPQKQLTNQTQSPNWWADPLNRYNLLLYILVLLVIIVLWIIFQTI